METIPSMEEKLQHLNKIAWDLVTNMESLGPEKSENIVGSEVYDTAYSIVDGLFDKRIYNLIIGKCSLQQIIDNPMEKLEQEIDDRILELDNATKRIGQVK